MPTHRDCPRPAAVVWATASYVRVPDRDTIPIQFCIGYFGERSCKRRTANTYLSRLMYVSGLDTHFATEGINN